MADRRGRIAEAAAAAAVDDPDALDRGRLIPRLALAVAAWIRYVGGTDEAGRPIDVCDPMATALRARLDAAGSDPGERVRANLGVAAVFGDDLPAAPVFVDAVATAYAGLVACGARRAVAALA